MASRCVTGIVWQVPPHQKIVQDLQGLQGNFWVHDIRVCQRRLGIEQLAKVSSAIAIGHEAHNKTSP